MPKTSLKQRNRKRVKKKPIINRTKSSSLIYFNIGVNNIETNVSRHNSNESHTDIKPSFPSTLTINELIKNSNMNNKPKLFPNAFIAYRMALIKEYRIKNLKLPSMGEVSKIARNYWNVESENVKDFYESLVKDAKLIYKQNNLQIILDKHMNNYAENKHTINFDTKKENTEHVEVQLDKEIISAASTEISLVNSSNFCTLYDRNLTLNDREYIRVLEQTIDYLLKTYVVPC
ncbi:hypothetical protein RclHR1_11740003 [Rhizophagus clarus]|uniref:HMG box domain-containing protein n=1 Tax=Rhizophagus clarus TaxID=94130 RepID=A0A2Z6QKA2_9GLOM|nr:hypothetical protein RclHR1_11740003 [Rhizophagus clarus]GES90963.1 hypothetical protein GLOIN_2v192848 [Rhizophagus clarus]